VLQCVASGRRLLSAPEPHTSWPLYVKRRASWPISTWFPRSWSRRRWRPVLVIPHNHLTTSPQPPSAYIAVCLYFLSTFHDYAHPVPESAETMARPPWSPTSHTDPSPGALSLRCLVRTVVRSSSSSSSSRSSSIGSPSVGSHRII
jgi:hypothetical protein